MIKLFDLLRNAFAMISAVVLICASGCAQYFDADEIHSSLVGHLFINELAASSSSGDDWIELYNPGSGPIDLSGFCLSDDLLNPGRWSFPDGIVITGRGHLVIDADSDITGLHTNFRLGTNEAVVLSTPGARTIIDSIDYSDLDVPEDNSFGRNIDGGDVWITFANPTKGSSNN